MTADPSAALAAIRARVDAATPGPWVLRRYPHGGGRLHDEDERNLIADLYDVGDREFIAHVRDDVPRLVAALDAVLALHRLIKGGATMPDAVPDHCAHDYDRWPCPTVAAITDALGGDR